LKNIEPAFKEITKAVANARMDIKIAKGSNLLQREFEVKYEGGVLIIFEFVCCA